MAWLLVCGAASVAQQPKVLAPHKPVPPVLTTPQPLHMSPVARSLIGGFWMTDAGMKSYLHITNDLVTSSLSVTPVLWLSNGVALRLPAVNLDPSGTAIISINQALADQGLAPYATLSGYVELDYQWPWDAICATVRNADVGHSLLFNYGLPLANPPTASHAKMAAQPTAASTQRLEGLWWKQEANVAGFVALSNPGTNPVSANLSLTDAQGKSLSQSSVTVSPHGTKMIELTGLPQSAGAAGGVSIQFDGTPNDLLVAGGLRDDAVGYSANIGFAPTPQSAGQSSTISYASLGLMTGAADPMMSFPSGTVFAPYSVVRNISSQPVNVTPNLWWMAGGAAKTVALASVTVAPGEAKDLNVPMLLAQANLKNYNGSVNLVLDVTGNPPRGAVLLSSGSVDAKNTYVFQVAPETVKESIAKNLSYWSTRDGDDTMVTLWNPADEKQDFFFTLFYASGHYRYPVHLNARATFTFNISQIVMNSIPDAEGNVIPAGIHEGSAELSGSQGEAEHILVSMEAGTYNVVKATCGTWCKTCQGAVNSWVTDDPFVTPFGVTHQLAFTVQNHSGTQVDDTSVGSWSSSSPPVASVSSGLVDPVSVGAVTILVDDTEYPIYTSGCYGYQIDCPLETGESGSDPGNVKPRIDSITPNWGQVGTSVQVTISGSGFGSAPTVATGSGITVTYGQRSDSSINATFAIAPNAAVGFQGVTVTNTSGDGNTPPSDPANFQVTPAVATPVNFHMISEVNLTNGSLVFTYTWSSSTGSQPDLYQCTLGETVYYPNYPSATYTWPLPMVQTTADPTVLSGPATYQSTEDTNYSPGNPPGTGFATPYSAAGFTATQKWWWACSNYNNNATQTLYPDQTVVRRVFKDTDGFWKFQITKSGYTNTIRLPNQ